MSEKVKKLLKERESALKEISNLNALLGDLIESLTLGQMKQVVNKKTQFLGESERIDLVDKIANARINYLKLFVQFNETFKDLTTALQPDDVDDSQTKLEEIRKKIQQNDNEANKAFKDLFALASRFKKQKEYIKIAKEASEGFDKFVKLNRKLEKIDKEVEKILKTIFEKDSPEKLQELLNQSISNSLARAARGENLTVSEAQQAIAQLEKNREKIKELRKQQDKRNKNKNPQKEKMIKQLKKGSVIKNIQELTMLYNQVLDVVPIRIIIEEALRCLLKKIGFDQWRRELCRSALKGLPESFLSSVILPLFKELVRFGYSVSAEARLRIRVSKIVDGKINPIYEKAFKDRKAFDAAGNQIPNKILTGKVEDGPESIYISRDLINKTKRNEPLNPSEVPLISELIRKAERYTIVNKVTASQYESFETKYRAYTNIKSASEKLLGPNLDGDHPQKGVYIDRKNKAFDELMEEVYELFRVDALCDFLFNEIKEFAQILSTKGLSTAWKELWEKAKTSVWPPTLGLPDVVFPVLDINKDWKKGLLNSLQQLLFQFVGTLAGFLADALSQACEDDLPGEVDMRTLLPPLETIFPDEPCIASLKDILDDLSLLLTPGEICALFEGDVASITYPINKDGFILNLHNHSQDEFYDFRTDELFSFIQKFVAQRYQNCAYIFGTPDMIDEFFKKLGEVSKACPQIAEKERKFCETDMQRELNKLRLDVFCGRDYKQDDIDCLLEKANKIRIEKARKLMDALFDDKFFERFVPPMNCYRDPRTGKVVEGLVPLSPTTEFMIDETLDGIYDTIQLNYTNNINSFIPFLIQFDQNGKLEEIKKEIPASSEVSFDGGKLVLKPGDSSKVEKNPIYVQNYQYGIALKKDGSRIDADDIESNLGEAPSSIYIRKGKRRVVPGLQDELRNKDFNVVDKLKFISGKTVETLLVDLKDKNFRIEYYIPKTKSVVFEDRFSYYFEAKIAGLDQIKSAFAKNPFTKGKNVLDKIIKQGDFQISTFKESSILTPDLKKALQSKNFSIKSDYSFSDTIPQKLFASYLENILENEVGVKLDQDIRKGMANSFYKSSTNQITNLLAKLASQSRLFEVEERDNGDFVVLENIDLDPTPTTKQVEEKCDVSLINFIGLKEGVKTDFKSSRCDVDPMEMLGKEEVSDSGETITGPSLIEQLTSDSVFYALIRTNIIDFMLRGIFATTQFGADLGPKSVISSDNLLANFFYDLFLDQLQKDLRNEGARKTLLTINQLKSQALKIYNRDYLGKTIEIGGSPYKFDQEKDGEESLKFLFNRELIVMADRFNNVIGLENNKKSLSFPVIDCASAAISGKKNIRLPKAFLLNNRLALPQNLFFERFYKVKLFEESEIGTNPIVRENLKAIKARFGDDFETVNISDFDEMANLADPNRPEKDLRNRIQIENSKLNSLVPDRVRKENTSQVREYKRLRKKYKDCVEDIDAENPELSKIISKGKTEAGDEIVLKCPTLDPQKAPDELKTYTNLRASKEVVAWQKADKAVQKTQDKITQLRNKLNKLLKAPKTNKTSSANYFKEVKIGARFVFIPNPVFAEKSLGEINKNYLEAKLARKIFQSTFLSRSMPKIRKQGAFYSIEPVQHTGGTSFDCYVNSIPIVSVESTLTTFPLNGVVEWNRNEKAFINKIKETPEYEFIVDYCLGESRIKSMITAYTVMKTTDFKREVADNFKATRKTLISIWEQMLKGSDYRYKNSLVKAGPVALAKGNQDIEDLILSFLIKAPWTILKVLAESYDPNIAISKGILDAGRAIAEVGINAVETGFSLAEQVGVAAEIAKEVAISTGAWRAMPEDERAGIDAAIDSLNDLPTSEERKEVYDEIRFYLNNIPTATVSIPIWFGLFIWPTTFGVVYLVGDAIEKAAAIYDHNKSSSQDPVNGELGADATNARNKLVQKMKGYEVDIDKYKEICKLEDKKKTPPSGKVVKSGLYTNGGEFVVKGTFEEYIGFYHIHENEETKVLTYMEFRDHIPGTEHRIIVPIPKGKKKPCD